MSYIIAVTNDLVCDHCGKVYINSNRVSNDILLNRAFGESWMMDDNGKHYCPKCKDKTVTLEIRFRWPNFYRMACVEQSEKNSGGNNPIEAVFEKDDELHICVDLSKAEKFAQLDTSTIKSLTHSEWENTISYIQIIYPDHKIKYNKLKFKESIKVDKITEMIFTYENKE